LKYPEKITLFANQIKQIKKQQKNNQSWAVFQYS
jgi:hypothetical protein